MQPSDIFINHVGRLRSGWRFAIYFLSLLIVIRFSFTAVALLLGIFVPNANFLEGGWGWVLQALILLAAATLLGWAYGKLFEDLPPRALGWGFRRGWLRDLFLGSIVGAASLALAALLASLFGGFSFTLNATAALRSVGQTILFSGLVFILAAAAEEAMFRGYPLQTMTRSGLAWAAIALTSVIFSIGHLNNPNVVKGFTFVNTALAGVWLGVAYLRTRTLWFALGVHWSWNWMMGAVLGLPVSGISNLTPNPLLRAEVVGAQWLTGGAYGIEGGAACTLALIISTIFIWRTRLLSADEEMKRFTEQENPKREPLPGVMRQQPFGSRATAVERASDETL